MDLIFARSTFVIRRDKIVGGDWFTKCDRWQGLDGQADISVNVLISMRLLSFTFSYSLNYVSLQKQVRKD